MRVLTTALLLLASAAAAPAALLTYNGHDNSRGEDIYLQVNGRENTVFAGVVEITIDNIFNSDALCVEFFKTISEGDFATNITTPDAINEGGRIAWLVENYLSTVNSTAIGAGLQLAVWDLVHDSGDGFASGQIRSAVNYTTPADVLAYANDFLLWSQNQSSSNALVYFNNNIGNGNMRQTLIGPGPTPGEDQVPEPATVFLTGAALLAFGALNQRRKKVSQ